jgi:NADH:ubiquinone oxidoreductase subunit 2 (subunit N)
MWFNEPAEGSVDAHTQPTPFALQAAMLMATAIVIVIGVYPQFFARLGELAFTPG